MSQDDTNPTEALPERPEERVEWTYAAEDTNALARRYDEWAKIYDDDLTGVHGYVAPQMAVDVLGRHADPSGTVLDAGAGTGLVGLMLAEAGFAHVRALDYSEGMLERAREKGVYETVEQADLNQPLALADDSVDAVICVGTLTYVEARVLCEFVRVTRPGGVIVYTSRTDTHVSKGFAAIENELSDFMKWKLLERSDEFLPMPNTYPDLVYRIYAWRVK